MRKTLPGYYRPTDEEFSELWENCLFVLDANVLLNLYCYSPETREELLGILGGISDRLWIPHQAALEYHQRHLGVIEQQTAAYDEIQKVLDKAWKKLASDLRSLLRRGRHPLVELDPLLERVKSVFTETKEELKKTKQEHPDWLDHDPIKDAITTLFEGKVGSPYPPERINEIYREGKTRYERKMPPGYQDADKGGVRQYGDLVLWFQVIDKATETKKPIILITDERKNDWWLDFKGKTIGPRPELVEEMATEAGVSFYMYAADPFMEYARKYLGAEVKQDAIDEIKDVRRHALAAVYAIDWSKMLPQVDWAKILATYEIDWSKMLPQIDWSKILGTSEKDERDASDVSTDKSEEEDSDSSGSNDIEEENSGFH